MRQIGWILLGAILAMTGQAVAQQSWFGGDTQGNTTTMYELAPGAYSWYDSRGNRGMMLQNPSSSIQQLDPTDLNPTYPWTPRNPC